MSRRVWRLAVILVVCSSVAAWGAPAAPGKRGRTVPPPHTVSRDNLRRLQAHGLPGAASAKPSAATLRFVALRIDFPDLAFGASPPADELHDRFYYENQFRYVSQYFSAASAGTLVLQVDVADVVARSAHPQAAYGDVAVYDSSMVELTAEAVRQADASVDFAAYDGVLLVHAGPGQESDVLGDSETQIWSGFLDDGTFREQLSRSDSVATGVPTGDGIEVRNIVVLPEWEVQDLQATGGTRLGSLGVYCHEVGQRLGMIPLFDASPRFPDSQGVGNFDLMAYGLWVANGFIPSLPSTFNRLLMGWLQPLEVRGGQSLELRDQERAAADSIVARVWISPREYFLVSYVLEDPDGPVIKTCGDSLDGPRRFFEFEDRNANCHFDYADEDSNGVLSAGDRIDSYAGAEWDFFMTDFQGGGTAGQGSGLLILHVDEQVLQETLARGSTNVEGDARRKAVDVEEADGIEDLDRGPDNLRSFGSADDYWPRRRTFGPQGVPDSRSTNGAPTGVSITLLALPDSSASGPGARARVQIDFGPTGTSAAAPRRRAWRDFPGDVGADPVTMYDRAPRGPIVVPADSGRVFLTDADLATWPTAKAAVPLVPWVQVPLPLRGDWIGAPATGRIDAANARQGVVLAARTDSAGVAMTRLFAWNELGTEIRDLDANPATNSGLFATLAGRATAPLVQAPFAGSSTDAVCVGYDAADSARVVLFHGLPAGVRRELARPGRFAGGPAGIAAPDAVQSLLAWAVVDSAADELRLVLQDGDSGALVQEAWLAAAVPGGPVRFAAGDLDVAAGDELVVTAAGFGLEIWSWSAGPAAPLGRRQHVDLAARNLSPLALADLDGDGTLEILVASESALHVLSQTGAEWRGWPYEFRREPSLESEPEPGSGAGSPLAVDVDGDGALEILLHLPGGALLVWTTGGERRRDLEAALPARSAFTPLVANLDGEAGAQLVAVGHFDAARGYLAPAESLVVARSSQVVVWNLPRAGAIAWGELGGGSGHAFHDATVRNLQVSANDGHLASFVVGPNPAGAEARARITLTAPAEVHCRLFTLEGEVVREASRTGTAGSIVEFAFDLHGLASGVYLAQMELSTGGRRTRPLAVRR